MDVITLDPTTYLPVALVEGYDSMIWTERYLDPGEFTMVTPKIYEMLQQIPDGTLISLMDSQEIMIVENHDITKDDNGVYMDTITGRSLVSFLENRVIGAEMHSAYAPNNARYLRLRPNAHKAALLIYDNIIHTPTYAVGGTDKSPYDLIPHCVVSLSVGLYTATSAVVDMGPVWDRVYETLSVDNLGLRTIRPSGTTYQRADFTDANPPVAAVITNVVVPDYVNIRFDIYDGVNRSIEAVEVTTPVIFDWTVGDIDDPEYLMSVKDYKNMIYLWTAWQEGYQVQPLDGDYTVAGLNRRVTFIDGSSWDSIGASSDTDAQAAIDRARQQLNQFLTTFFFSGAISPRSDVKYKTDYFLGDRVTLRAEFGLVEKMQVMEYVRTEDESGEIGYPTLRVAPPEVIPGIITG